MTLEQRLAQIAEENGYGAEIQHAMRLAAEAAMEWLPIDDQTPTDVIHFRGLWIHGPGKHGTSDPLFFEAHAGYVDDDGYFVDQSGNEYGWSANDYTHYMPFPEPPKVNP